MSGVQSASPDFTFISNKKKKASSEKFFWAEVVCEVMCISGTRKQFLFVYSTDLLLLNPSSMFSISRKVT